MAAPPLERRRRTGRSQRPTRQPPKDRPSLTRLILLALWDSLSRAQHRAKASRRLFLITAGYLVLTLIMGWRLAAVQLVDAEVYAGWAAQQTQREIDLPASRGAVTDRNGDPLAMSLSTSTIYANPPVLEEAEVDPFIVAGELAEVIPGVDVQSLAESLSSDRAFVYLGRQLPREVGESVTDLGLPGIGVLEEPKRVYPSDRVASQVVGWAGLDNNGLAGLELQMDEALAGTDGTLRLERAPGGIEISSAPREVVPATPGVDVRLTIDREVQFNTEQILIEAVEEYSALGGSAVVMEVETGEILAMASVPSVAPSNYAASTEYDRRNRAITDVFEPGSVNKVITIAGALEDGVVQPDQYRNVPSEITLGPETYSDSEPHPDGWWTTRDIMTRSSNVGTIQIARELGEERLYDYVTDFGLGSPTGLDFPGESRGLLAEVDDWSGASLPTIAIGQGVAATLVQTAQVFRVIANDGVWTQPQLVQGTVDHEGTFLPTEAGEPRRVVSSATAATVADMLIEVVESPNGTGGLAAVPGYSVGGKTGTAQKPLEGELGYAENAFIATFAGFAPVENPRFVVAVMLDEPTPFYGGLSAAPTFSQIMQFALRDQRVAPANPPVPMPVGQDLGHSIAAQPESAVSIPDGDAAEDDAVIAEPLVDEPGDDPAQ